MVDEGPDGWRLARFRDFLKESRLTGSSGGVAQKLTVRLYGKGVVAKVNDRGGSAATKYYKRRKGQLIFSKLDFLNGAFGLVPPDLDGYESTLDLPCFDIAPDVDPDWLLSVLIRPAFYRRYRGMAIGSRKAQRVPVEEFLASVVTTPPTEEQQRISRFLAAVDAVIGATSRFVAELHRSKHWLMRELLTKGHAKYRTKLVPLPESWPIGRIASTIDKMPSHWKLATLTKIAKLESGHTPSRKEPDYWSGDIPWLSLPDSYRLDELEVNDADGRISPLGIANSSARMLPVGSVLLIRTGGSRGKCSRLAKTMACSQDYVAFVPGPELDSRYLQQVFRHMQREWQRLSDGSTTLRNIFMHAFKRLKILVPPLKEQAAIADVGEAFDLRITAETRYLEQLRQTKRGLAQALLSGRVRVAASKTNGARATGAARRR
jgi:type I restriction enzyme S subunit